MDDGELRSALETTGLTQYQAAAYLSLLELGAAPAADIAEKSGVPGPRIYDVLRDLETRGYVELYKQGQLHARVHDPSTVIETFEHGVEQFKAAKQSVEERWQQPSLENYAVSIAKRRETAFERAALALEDAENQIKICVNETQFDRFQPYLRAAFEEGVAVKVCVWTDPAAGGIEDVSRFSGVCTEVRHRTLPSPFVAIVDRDTVCFAPNDQSMNEYGVIVHDPSHAFVFNVFFQSSLWTTWETVFEEPTEDAVAEYVDIRECVREVDRLLDAGRTVHARIIGTDVETGESVELAGEIIETGADSPREDRWDATPPLLHGIASITVVTDDGTFTVGGWGAMLEDIEANRVTITTVDPPEAVE